MDAWIPVAIAIVAAIPGIYAALSQSKKDAGTLALDIAKELKAQVHELELKQVENEKVIEQLQNNNLELKGEVYNVQIENIELKKELDTVKRENNLLKKGIAEREERIGQLQVEIDALNSRIDFLERGGERFGKIN